MCIHSCIISSIEGINSNTLKYIYSSILQNKHLSTQSISQPSLKAGITKQKLTKASLEKKMKCDTINRAPKQTSGEGEGEGGGRRERRERGEFKIKLG